MIGLLVLLYVPWLMWFVAMPGLCCSFHVTHFCQTPGSHKIMTPYNFDSEPQSTLRIRP